ncbi:unnamed protein product [Rotaria sp. Silwood1]|nr:unnamed protein product [Rotaria sp. Silwood1]
MNVPVIKRSQIKDKLDHDEATGNIRWTQHSIDVLLQVIKQAAEQRRSPLPTIDQSLIPWRITRDRMLVVEVLIQCYRIGIFVYFDKDRDPIEY